MTVDGPRRPVPKRRFPKFATSPGWDRAKVDEIVETVAPPKKLPTSAYAARGAHPIVDQSPHPVCGWTDDPDAVIASPSPVIVFGDHTCVLKLVDHPFAQGADGIKILSARGRVSIPYLYHQLSHRPLEMEQYKRHFSTLRERLVCYPGPREQEEISGCLGSLADLAKAEGRRIDILRRHKRGLLQLLFPAPGASRPRLRFPRFESAPGWSVATLGSLLQRPPEYGVNAAAAPFSEDLPTYVRITDITEDGRLGPGPRVSVDIAAGEDQYLREGDVVFARTGASVGKSYRHRQEDGRLVYAGFLIRVRPDQAKLLPDFLTAYLSCRDYATWVRHTSTRSGQPGINGAEYASMPVPLPTGRDGLDEQRRVSDCVRAVDDEIELRTRKLDSLDRHRRGLAQQIFPTPGGT